MVTYLVDQKSYPVRRACQLVKISRNGFSYQAKKTDDHQIRELLKGLANRYKRWGFGLMFQWLRNQGHPWNHKRVYRVYCELKLNFRIKPRKRLPKRTPLSLMHPLEPNYSWSMDFMSDSLISGKAFRTLNIIDDFNRESLAIEIDLSLPAPRVIRVLNQLKEWRGLPEMIRVDNGPEFISKKLAIWSKKNNVMLNFIKPGTPTQNAYIERFNRTFRQDILDMYLFSNLREVREHSTRWMYEYNAERPHSALKNMTPVAWAKSRTV